MAFRLAAGYAFRQALLDARPNILEPIMKVEVALPTEYQGTAIALLNKRKGQMTGSEAQDLTVVIHADVPLSQMFGFSTELRSATQGKGARTAPLRRRRRRQTSVPRSLTCPPASLSCALPSLPRRRVLHGVQDAVVRVRRHQARAHQKV
jgi:hypothetical protein